MTTIIVEHRYVVGAAKVLEFTDETGFEFPANGSATPSMLLNLGQVTVTETGAGYAMGVLGLRHAGPEQFVNAEGASLTVSSAQSVSFGVGLGAPGSRIVNHGDISVSGLGAYGLVAQGAGSQIKNAGTLMVTVDASATGVTGNTIRNSGSIEVHADDARGVELTDSLVNKGSILVEGSGEAWGVQVYNQAHFRNAGDLTAISHDPANPSVAMVIYPAPDFVHIANSGSITADELIFTGDGGSFGAPVVIRNTGEMTGDISNPAFILRLFNEGVIHGDIVMAGHDDLYSGTLGHFTGTIAGGGGDDKLFGGTQAETFYGDEIGGGGNGADVLRGAGGDDSLHGGAGADTLWGGADADLLEGGTGADLFIYAALTDSAPGASDLITDLEADDFIDLSRIDADPTTHGRQHLTADQVTLTFDAASGNTWLDVDVGGEAGPEMRIVISGDHTDFTGIVL